MHLLVLDWAAGAIVVGHMDTFSTDGAAGWMNGANANTPPTVVASGGPLGSGDGYLSLITSGSHNTQSRLVTFNSSSNWTGNYLSAGVAAIEMDLKNFGDAFGSPVTLEIRFAIKEAVGSAPGYSTKVSFAIEADGKWHHIRFSLAPEDLVAIGEPTLTLSELLANPAEVRILHSIEPAVKGDLVNGLVTVGIDNIQVVPEPSTALILLIAVSLATARSRRRSPL
jgi:hypothetical protein